MTTLTKEKKQQVVNDVHRKLMDQGDIALNPHHGACRYYEPHSKCRCAIGLLLDIEDAQRAVDLDISLFSTNVDVTSSSNSLSTGKILELLGFDPDKDEEEDYWFFGELQGAHDRAAVRATLLVASENLKPLEPWGDEHFRMRFEHFKIMWSHNITKLCESHDLESPSPI